MFALARLVLSPSSKVRAVGIGVKPLKEEAPFMRKRMYGENRVCMAGESRLGLFGLHDLVSFSDDNLLQVSAKKAEEQPTDQQG